jgi:hypothetical protein
VLAAFLQAMVHRHFMADAVAIQALLDAFRHLGAEGVFHGVLRVGAGIDALFMPSGGKRSPSFLAASRQPSVGSRLSASL